jgi:cyclophilin family peptidyl-prolyl cis-trans isomerase
VANFVELATGAKEWVDPNIGEKVKTNLYDGTIFHRVIPNFMIQGGDPLGSGMGGQRTACYLIRIREKSSPGRNRAAELSQI